MAYLGYFSFGGTEMVRSPTCLIALCLTATVLIVRRAYARLTTTCSAELGIFSPSLRTTSAGGESPPELHHVNTRTALSLSRRSITAVATGGTFFCMERLSTSAAGSARAATSAGSVDAQLSLVALSAMSTSWTACLDARLCHVLNLRAVSTPSSATSTAGKTERCSTRTGSAWLNLSRSTLQLAEGVSSVTARPVFTWTTIIRQAKCGGYSVVRAIGGLA